jgi:hypothetical protein
LPSYRIQIVKFPLKIGRTGRSNEMVSLKLGKYAEKGGDLFEKMSDLQT